MSVLDTIDGALADYQASGDAMRWVPEGKRAATPVIVPSEQLAAASEALGRDMARFLEGIQAMSQALQPIMEAQVKAFSKTGHAIHRSFYPKQHQRCVTCHPWRKSKPLAVNGREYQRRLKARRRRR